MVEPSSNASICETVEVSGHIIDSLILPKILDSITAAGGRFDLERVTIGQRREDPSYARIKVSANDADRLADILANISDHGARSVEDQNCRIEPADIEGAFPEGFYSTTNQRTQVRIEGSWCEVAGQEMDCGIAVDRETGSVRCVPMNQVRKGDQIVVGHAGVRVYPHDRGDDRQSFEFMNSSVSTEKPKGLAIRRVAETLFRNKREGGKTVIVGGPAIVHTGSVGHFSQLIRSGYVNKLFAGNALATHDIEQALFGTSLGVRLDCGDIVEAGHEHHLRSINTIRRLGGIRNAVEQGRLTSGIMYDCIQHDVEVLLAGSIRDDGPLPEVITDVLEAQQLMREQVQDVSVCLMIATTLHSIAVGNLLPAWVQVVCVDINPSTVIKLSDRGSFQTVGIVTDVEPFLRALVADLQQLESAEPAG